MPKVQQKEPFFKVNKLDLRFGLGESILLAYVAEFEANHLVCFASRSHIATQLNISETKVQDTIKRLVKAGALRVSYQGRKRTLETNQNRNKGIGFQPERDRNSPPQGIGIRSHQGSEYDPMRDRNPIHTKNNITKIHITNNNYKDNIQTKPSVSARARETYAEVEFDESDIPD